MTTKNAGIASGHISQSTAFIEVYILIGLHDENATENNQSINPLSIGVSDSSIFLKGHCDTKSTLYDPTYI